MYIPQLQLQALKKKVKPGKVVVIYGPRRTGKTTLLQHFLREEENYLFVNGEDIDVHEYLASRSVEKLKRFIAEKKLLVIDEAQNIDGIGANLKLVVDHCPDVKVVVTGSSSFELANQIGEPLTGRRSVLHLFPISQIELNQLETPIETGSRLDTRLIYGSYPEVVLIAGDDARREYLHELKSAYLYKDILQIDGVKNAKKMLQILQLIAFQIGKEVSIHEVASRVSGISRNTVERYLDLLEKVFVLVNIRGFSRNLRKEVTKTSRYYFYDLGVRNAVINNFNSSGLRDDIGALWENYLVMERIKKQHYNGLFSNNYFWRTYDQKELDWVEERDGKLFGYEFKWGKKIVGAPKLWLESYPEASFELINRDNYIPFIS